MEWFPLVGRVSSWIIRESRGTFNHLQALRYLSPLSGNIVTTFLYCINVFKAFYPELRDIPDTAYPTKGLLHLPGSPGLNINLLTMSLLLS